MVKLIVIFFVVIFSAISVMAKKAREADAARRQQMDSQRPHRPMYPEPPVVEDFDDEFKFLYEDDIVAEAQDNEPFDAHKEGESVVNATVVEPESETAAMAIDADDWTDCDDELERWRRSIIDAEILKTKF